MTALNLRPPPPADLRIVRRPTLIIRGLGQLPMRPAVVADYRRTTTLVEVMPFAWSGLTGPENYAHKVAAVLRSFRERVGGPFNIVAHSMGGLASLYALKHLQTPTDVLSVVTFGTPYDGVPAAWWTRSNPLLRRYTAAFRPNSRFLAEMHEGDPPPDVRLVSLAGTDDWLCPAACCQLHGSEYLRLPLAHNDFLWNRSLHAIIRSFLF